MRHHNKNKKFGRKKDQRHAFMRSLALSLIINERIQTTETRAKALRPYVEKLVTKSRVNDLPTRRLLISRLGSEEIAKKLIDEIAPRYSERAGGYTRITKMGSRKSDASPQAIIEFV